MKTAAPPATSIRRSRGVRSAVLVAILLLAVAAGLYNQQTIQDYWTLRGYQAPSDVAAIAQRDTMTAAARRIFYVNKPDIADKAAFARQCPAGNEQTVVLGCYQSGVGGIYVLKVTDSRLDGIEEVTAAHEMLHAAYDRLSSRQQKQLDGQLQDFYNHGLTDDTIRKQIDSYKTSEPDAVVNEMHSIFGTEVANLPAPLETYYKKYFTSRSAITTFYNQYEEEFTGRQAAIKADDKQLADIKSQITTAEASLKDQAATLQARELQLNDLRASGDTASYNAQVPGYNTQVDSYNNQVAAIKQLIDQYNQLVNARNALVLEAQQLTNEITSTVAPLGN